MEDKSTPLWDGSTAAPKEFRLPNTTPTKLLKGDSHDENTTNDMKTITAQSKLSVDAPEWFPAGYKPEPACVNPAGCSSVQDRLRRHKITDNDATGPDCEFVDSSDDVRLRHLITTLTKDPGQFGDLLDIFLDTLFPYYEDIIVLARAAQLLVDQAVECPSFRYTAARLCCSIEQQCPAFRAELHITCKKELEQSNNKSGLLLFVAELYMQLHHENIYGAYLIDAYKHLLDIGGNENIKSVCQALKLTGYSLELYDKKALDGVFTKLTSVKSSVSGTVLNLIDSVINLKSSEWGHNSPNNMSSNTEQENYYWGEIQNTVFYNADGTQFSNEESAFLAANMYTSEEYLTDLSDPDELCDPEPEMDEEIQAAFRDFVKLSKR